MGNTLGREIKVDETTLKKEIGYYSSVLVEIYLAKFIPCKIEVKTKYEIKEVNHLHQILMNKEWKSQRRNGEKNNLKKLLVLIFASQKKNYEQFKETIIESPNNTELSIHQRGEPSSGRFHILQDPPEEFTVNMKPHIILVSSTSQESVEKVKDKHIPKERVIKPNVTTRKQAASSSWPEIKSKDVGIIGSKKIQDFSPSLIWLSGPKINVKKDTIKKLSQEITIEVGGSLITSIHAASLTVDGRALWSTLEEINNLNKPWLILGDFNAVLSIEEKKGGRSPLRVAMLEFNSCVHNCELIQAPKTGLEYSWCNNRVRSKRIVCNLDRTFYNTKWLEKNPSWGYKVGVRGVSDHGYLCGANAIIPKPADIPFRALKVWIEHDGFFKLVEDNWKLSIKGNPGFFFLSKLKRLKQIIKDWNWNVFGDVNHKIQQAEKNVMEAALESDRNP
ncbi:uncharacterized protein LOC113279794 [Papaver somniferum]|uniref:uncharacterized protein LOC113279794 n=1 Tax=Papaver somniferum TaxID=3469 RepID=UPI000E6FF72E|nr:uncharacterized protein LOC113279794 [Papaver somniferum]